MFWIILIGSILAILGSCAKDDDAATTTSSCTTNTTASAHLFMITILDYSIIWKNPSGKTMSLFVTYCLNDS